MHITINSLMFDLVCRLLSMIVSNGFRKCFWKFMLENSSFNRNLSASYLRESMAKRATLALACDPTKQKCSLIVYHMVCHTNRIRSMLRSATSTRHWRENFRGLVWSASSALDILQRLSMKQIIASGSSKTLF